VAINSNSNYRSNAITSYHEQAVLELAYSLSKELELHYKKVNTSDYKMKNEEIS
jgi:hypothetical protein